ncbi:nuclear receptor-binding protein homolog isoform X2 [Diabrotica undecimpunctata]|uniref:nuclear receptor-binding protein homolog isoform X2 n=1 Tax=Diabrotica undecimpunctata TaxID=50387 RepID=UPI003B63FB48
MSGSLMNIEQEHKSPRESGEDSEDESEILEESPCGRWLKRREEVIFITEYMSSGSLKQFLKRTKRNVKKLPLQAWRRWCTQILSALSYLHSCCPPIVHGNLTCDTIFIQHNGLVKIGSVAPDSINHHVKTCQDDFKNMHFIAPEHPTKMGPPIDIYSFGMCALEMAALEIIGNGDSGNKVTEENVKKTIDSLEHEHQKNFILKCLAPKPEDRPTSRELLFHPLLFEVHSLKLLAAHCLVRKSANISDTITDELMQRWYGPDVIVAEMKRKSGECVQMKMANITVTEKLEKFVEDVKNGIYPLTAFGAKQPPPSRSRAISPEMTESVKSVTPEPTDVETRKIVNMMCDVKSKEESCDLLLTIVLRMDDKMNRQLTSYISPGDNPKVLAQELVHYGFINEVPFRGEWNTVAEGFKERWNFPNCCGAIDGKHALIKAPPNSGSEYYNFKGQHSVVRMAVVDHKYCFSYINVGFKGSNSDGGVFQNCAIYEALENSLLPDGPFLVGDDAFPLKMYLMKPYSGYRRRLTINEQVFNYRLTRAKRIRECICNIS